MWLKVQLFSLFREKRTTLAIMKLICSTVSCASVLYTFVDIIIPGFMGLEIFCKKYWWSFIIVGLIISFIHNREKTTLEKTIDGLQIEICINNLFHVNADSYLIPTNTFFRTNMEGDYISSNSVQGTFQLSFFKGKMGLIDSLIEQNLNEQGLIGEESSDKFGAVKKYPVGTVAKVDWEGNHYYFAAINDVNKFGKPEGQSYENIHKTLTGIIETIKKIGHCDNLAMPLIGTGRAAIKGAGKEKVVKDIIDKFTEEPNKIVNKLIICINPNDYIEKSVNIGKIKKYLDYKQEFCGY